MRRTEKQLTGAETRILLQGVIDIITDDYDKEVDPSFQKDSRSAQIGYKIQRFLLDEKIIEPGKKDNQRRLEV